MNRLNTVLTFSHLRAIPMLVACLFLVVSILQGPVGAQEAPEDAHPATSPGVSMSPDPRLEATRTQLANIARSIQERREYLAELRQRLDRADTTAERVELGHEINELENLIQVSRASFETIATGGVDSAIFRDQPEQPFDWQRDLFEIIEPFLDQLKQLTEAPRAIERLNRQIAEDQFRLAVVERALMSIENIRVGIEDEDLLQRLHALERTWNQRRGDIQLEMDLLRQRLTDLQEDRASFWTMARQGLMSFIRGRGLILILAVVATGTVWFVMQALPKSIRRRKGDQEVIARKPHSRLMTYGYQALCGLMAMITLLLVLYVSGDWLLLGLALIILFLVAIGSKNYLPRFMTEARMLLDMGPVREGERIILNGIPWQVKSLNMYSTLVNPELLGGVLRMPLSELAGRVSRPDDPDEPWFPTRKEDYVLLADGAYGQVLLQTPEVVQVKHVGAVRTFSTTDFLGSSPRNLTRNGFGFVVTFGIDYQHQAICLEQVPDIFETAVTEALKTSFGDGLESVLVDFKEAGASSLDYLFSVMMRGSAAGSYWAVGRTIQQACVRVCNEQGWVIPFTQLTVHQGDGFEALRGDRS